jgi:hypothetical protein
MIRIRQGSGSDEIYVYDDDAQPGGAEGSYWWDYSKKSMYRFVPKPEWDLPSNVVTDQAMRANVTSDFEQWKVSSLEVFLLEEAEYWKQRRDSEPKYPALQKDIEALIAILKSSDNVTFADGWKKLFPKGLFRLVAANIHRKTGTENHEFTVPYTGKRLSSFLVNDVLPLRRISTEKITQYRIASFSSLKGEFGSNSVDLMIRTAEEIFVYSHCIFDCEPLVRVRSVEDSVIALITILLEIADPQLIDTVFDDQFKTILLGIGNAELGERRLLFREPCERWGDNSGTPHTIRFLARVVDSIQLAIANRLRSSEDEISIIYGTLGVPWLIDIVNALLVGLNWTPSKVLEFAEKVFRPSAPNTFDGLAGGGEALRQFVASSIFGKQVLAEFAVSLAERRTWSNMPYGYSTLTQLLYLGVLSKAEFDLLTYEDIYGTFDDAASWFLQALPELDPIWLEDSHFCDQLLRPLSEEVTRTESLARDIRYDPKKRIESENGHDFSCFPRWLVPLVRELKGLSRSASGHSLAVGLESWLERLSAANVVASGSLKLIDVICSDY